MESPMQVIRMLAMNEINGVFWFFYVLFGLYLCIPVLSLVVNKEKVSVLYYLVLIWLVNVVALPMLERFVGIPVLQGSGGVTIGVAFGYVGYLILGWLLHHIEIDRKQRGVIYILGLLSLVWMVAGTYLLNKKGAEGFDDFFMGYMSIDCILLSIAVVVFFKTIPWDSILKPDGKLKKGIQALARASFGVYLLQMLVIQVLQILLPIDPFSYRYMTVRAVLVYGVCVGITLVGQKMPGVRRAFP